MQVEKTETAQVTYLTAGSGRAFAGNGTTIVFKDEPANNEGLLFVFELRFSPGVQIPPHLEANSEAFFVLDGNLEITADGKLYRLKAGDFLRMSAGTLHSVHNPGPGQMRALAWTLPGTDHARFFEGINEPTSDPNTPPPFGPPKPGARERLLQVARECNMEFRI